MRNYGQCSRFWKFAKGKGRRTKKNILTHKHSSSKNLPSGLEVTRLIGNQKKIHVLHRHPSTIWEKEIENQLFSQQHPHCHHTKQPSLMEFARKGRWIMMTTEKKSDCNNKGNCHWLQGEKGEKNSFQTFPWTTLHKHNPQSYTYISNLNS